MRILVGKCFGLGNACLSVPMIKAIISMGHSVDVLCGSTADDFGADDVLYNLNVRLFKDIAPDGYDVAIMSIPFDGRWVNGTHYQATMVIDGRKRPGNVDRLGFDMWEKHEVEYQMENARELGYSGPTPDGRFLPHGVPDEDLVYLGTGFKRDPGGFGKSKHFGTTRYALLIREIARIRPGTRFVSTGTSVDRLECQYQILRDVCDLDRSYTVDCHSGGLSHAFDVVRGLISATFQYSHSVVQSPILHQYLSVQSIRLKTPFAYP